MLHKPRQVDDHLRECGQIRTKTLEQRFELRDHKNQQNDGNDDGNNQYGCRIEQRFLDFLLQRFGLFLVGRNFVQQSFERAGLFAGFDQIYE